MIGSNHAILLQTLSDLGQQVNYGNRLLRLMLRQQRQSNVAVLAEGSRAVEPEAVLQTVDQDALSRLRDCLSFAEDIHERYTSQYAPDDRSMRGRDADFNDVSMDEIPTLATSVSESASQRSPTRPPSTIDLDDMNGADLLEDEEDIWPLEILDRHIAGYRERAESEQLAGHYNQAEVNLNQAIQFSQTRADHYGVPFADRLRMEEDIAFFFQKQAKFAEAVSKVNQLLRDRRGLTTQAPEEKLQNDLAEARLHQLLSSIYLDRHLNSPGGPLASSTDDAENAEKHAKRAFNRRYNVSRSPGLPLEEAERHSQCIDLLVRILNERGKTVEANTFADMGIEGSSTTGASITRTSTSVSRNAPDYDLVEGKNELLVEAILSGDADQIQLLLSARDIELDQLCRGGRTPLMHAVSRSDERTVCQLLDPRLGANVDKQNKRGSTVLHFAAERGDHAIVRCLIDHGADKDAQDTSGQTPLVKAVKGAHETVIQILFERGADMSKKDTQEWSAIHHAVHQPNLAIPKLILTLKPEMKDDIDQAGKTALHYCAELELEEHAQALLEHKHKLDVNAIDSRSRTPLYFAASKPSNPKRESMVRLLVRHGAELNESRQLPRLREYAALKPLMGSARSGTLPRRQSASTTGTMDTASSVATRLSSIFSRA